MTPTTSDTRRRGTRRALGAGAALVILFGLIQHSDARLNAAQRQQLIDAITQLYQTDPPASIRQNRD